MKCIVYNRHDGGVSVCRPSDEIFSIMSSGGLWSDRPRGYADIQIERMIVAGIHKDAAHRFAKAVQFGGLTTAEAYEVIRARDCGHLGSAFELWTADQFPDRWFRDAWRRSHNGGPISIDLKKAKGIQFQKISAAVHKENKRRVLELERFDRPVDVDFQKVRQRINLVDDENQLRMIWPNGLNASTLCSMSREIQRHPA